jgi:hypothetical protein
MGVVPPAKQQQSLELMLVIGPLPEASSGSERGLA